MISRWKNVVFTALLCLIPAAGSYACGPWFQPHYANGKSPYWTILHETAAVRRLIANLSDLIPVVPEIKEGISTNGAIRQDFSEAVNRYLPKLPQVEKQKLIDDYLKFVIDARKTEKKSMDDFPDLPEELAEFRLYREGVCEMKPDGKEIPYSWQKLLELPRKLRHYRTVWVYFMLGNYLHHDCSRYYAACRAAAREGFADTPGLVMASYKNELRFTKDPVRKIHLALEFMRNSPGILISLNDMTNVSESECAAMLADPLCREVLAIYGCKLKTFERDVWKYKFRNADIMAWRAYDEGKVEKAEKYLKLRVSDTLLSTYIEAKIARHHGDNELAIRKLRQWLKFVAKIDPNDRADLIGLKHILSDPYDQEPTYPLCQDVYGLLGSALVYRRDFAEAAMYFYRAGQIEADVTYIAENLMSLKELAAFADSVSNDLKSQNGENSRNVQLIRHMTARRAFREGKFDIARKYMPENYKGVMNQYLAFIRASKDRSLPRNTRALCLYNAAKIMRWHGMELCGTEGSPDDAFHGGDHGISREFEDCPNCKYDPASDAWTAVCPKHFEDCSKLIRKGKDPSGTTVWLPASYRIYPFSVEMKGGSFTKYIPAPQNQRFHYRYRAAELAGQSAGMAQDEDLRALANLLGGECLRHRTPRKANVFYRRLVKECPNNAVAKIADKLRWFPTCPALNGELRSMEPCKSLADAKEVMKKSSIELEEIRKQKEEEQRRQELAVQRKKLLEKFFSAVCENDLREAEKLLAQGVDVNAKDDRGLAPLHYAAACRHSEMVRWLLAHGAGVNIRTAWNYRTPLHYAMVNDDVTCKLPQAPNPEKIFEIVKILTEAKADVNAASSCGASPVYLATGNLKLLKYLLGHGGDLDIWKNHSGQSSLHWAICGNVPVENIEFLLKCGVKINNCDANGYTPLHYAVRHRNLPVVKCLAEHGADLNIVEEKEWETALDLAVKDGLSGIAEYLKAHGAVSGKSIKDPRRQLKRLFSAVRAGDPQKTLEALELGADAKGEDEGGLCPLHYAVLVQNLEIIKHLLAHDANVNHATRGLQATPLHYAVTQGNLEIIKYLVSHGADIYLQDKEGKCALGLANERKLRKTAAYLIDAAWGEKR